MKLLMKFHHNNLMTREPIMGKGNQSSIMERGEEAQCSIKEVTFNDMCLNLQLWSEGGKC